MPLYIAQSGDLDRCYRCLTDRLTTLKDRATQLLIKYKSGGLVTQWWIFDNSDGEGDILPILTAMIPGRAGRNQTRLSKGTWEGVDTIRGVTWISVNCHFFLLKKIHTKRKQLWYWTTSSTSTFRGDFPKKSCCSFGFCPNYLLLLPIWTTCTTFLNAKNVDLSDMQNDSLSKILLK